MVGQCPGRSSAESRLKAALRMVTANLTEDTDQRMSAPTESTLHSSPLGQATEYPTHYTPSLLHPIPRSEARSRMGVTDLEGVYGEDVWTCYEFSWLSQRGMPRVAVLGIRVPISSRSIVESKSLKLYLNSFAQTRFDSVADVQHTLDSDLKLAFMAPLIISLHTPGQTPVTFNPLPGDSLDGLDVEIESYEHDIALLGETVPESYIKKSWYTDLFRSLCPVTSQPDWASVHIEYAGPEFDPAALLRYLVSYRNHQAFHESTIEQIFVEMWATYAPRELSVHGRFLRRGGIEINPFRCCAEQAAPEVRVVRQ